VWMSLDDLALLIFKIALELMANVEANAVELGRTTLVFFICVVPNVLLSLRISFGLLYTFCI
jgi:hypothetical protein